MAEWCAAFLEATGIAIITVLALYALLRGVVGLVRAEETESLYHTVRQQLGHGILLGLEFLVAADIIHTVAVELTFRTVGVLAIIVLIRTFLSFTLDVELTGHWPWNSDRSNA
jgi:uncharacterized membrane protein